MSSSRSQRPLTQARDPAEFGEGAPCSIRLLSFRLSEGRGERLDVAVWCGGDHALRG
jgi:hypothetical protein